MSLDVQGQLTNSDAIILATDRLELSASSINNLGESTLQANQLTFDSNVQSITNEGQINTASDINLDLQGVIDFRNDLIKIP